jgi:type IV pilus assembly protein PilW
MRKLPRPQHGFSLIEIMVALAIGVLSIITVLELYLKGEISSRITTHGNDAQISANMALHELGRVTRQAGYGLNAFNLLGCSLGYTTNTDKASVTLSNLAPVTVNPDVSLVPKGDANTDTLLVVGGSAATTSEGDPLTSTPMASATGTAFVVSTADYFVAGDWVIASPLTRSTTCSLFMGTVSSVSSSIELATTVNSAATSVGADGVLYDLGSTPSIKAWAVRDGRLTVCDFLLYNCGRSSYVSDQTIWVPVVSRIVSLRAQYARDTSGISGATSKMTGVADAYDQITPGGSSDTASIPVYCKWARVIGLRFAVVGRSQHTDKTYTASNPSWSGDSPTAIDLSASGSTWAQYRYRLMETTMPLRNIIWQGSQTTYQGGDSGC